MKKVSYVPLFGILLFVYNIMVFAVDDPAMAYSRNIIDTTLISGAHFQLNINELMIIVGLNFLYLEVFKSIRTSISAMIDHALSMMVFIVYLVEFIVVERLGVATFLILTVMSLVDVIAGFTISISAARRDISVAS